MKLDRFGDITAELTASLVKAIVLPNGLLEWLSRPLSDSLRDRLLSGSRPRRSGESAESPRSTIPAGPMLLLGGAPAPDEAIIALMHLAGGRSARLAVLPVAAADQAGVGEQSLRLFTRFGMRKAGIYPINSKKQANDLDWATRLAEFDAVFVCGEDAGIGLDLLQGSLCHKVLLEMHAAGKPVGGMAGGAMMLGDLVALKNAEPEAFVPGLGLASGLLVETGFTQKGRFDGLVKALEASEGARGLLGLVLDDGAAVAIREAEAKVLGESHATFIDPHHKSAAGGAQDVKVHVLLEQFGLNLRTRNPIAPPKETAKAAGDR